MYENEYECGCIQTGTDWTLCKDCKAAREHPIACACCE